MLCSRAIRTPTNRLPRTTSRRNSATAKPQKNARDKYEPLDGIPSPLPRGYWSEHANRRKFANKLALKLGFDPTTTPEGWYSVTVNDWREHGGGALLQNHYSTSLVDALSDLYPDHQWLPWKFQKAPRRYWDDAKHQRAFMEFLAYQELKLRDIKELKIQSLATYIKYGGGGLLATYNDSVIGALAAIFPEISWNFVDTSLSPPTYGAEASTGDALTVTDFKRVSAKFWTKIDNQRRYLNWIYQHLGFTSMDDWYHLSTSKFRKTGPHVWVTNYYGSSLSKAIQTVYPEHKWLPWKFSPIERGYWQEVQNVKRVINYMMEELNIETDSLDKWYSVDSDEFKKHGAASLLLSYGSPVKILQLVFPDHTWIGWRFAKRYPGAWNSERTRREFCDWMMKEMKMQDMSGWYKVTTNDFLALGGNGLLGNYYNNSVTHALTSIYPDHEWSMWEFNRLPKGHWKQVKESGDTNQVKRFITYISKKLGIQDKSDWYRVSVKDTHALTSTRIIDAFGGLYEVLRIAYPEHTWEEGKFTARGKKSAQWKMRKRVKEIFPNEEMLEETRNRLPDSLNEFRFDLYLPQLSIAFEYDGEQHFDDISNAGQFSSGLDSEKHKMALCQKEGITLISVPYWWDGNIISLANTIRMYRHGVVPSSIPEGPPIPNQPPQR